MYMRYRAVYVLDGIVTRMRGTLQVGTGCPERYKRMKKEEKKDREWSSNTCAEFRVRLATSEHFTTINITHKCTWSLSPLSCSLLLATFYKVLICFVSFRVSILNLSINILLKCYNYSTRYNWTTTNIYQLSIQYHQFQQMNIHIFLSSWLNHYTP